MSVHVIRYCSCERGVALTGRNRTGPPCSVDRPRARVTAALETTDASEKKKQYWPIRRASNNAIQSCLITVQER